MRISTVIAPLIPLAYLLWELRKKKRQAERAGTEQESKLPSIGLIFLWLVPVGGFIFIYTLLLLCGTGSSATTSIAYFSPVRWLSIILYFLLSGLTLYFYYNKDRTRALHGITAILVLFSANLIYEGIKAILQKDITTLMEHYQGNGAVSQGILLIVIGALAIVFWLTASALGKKFMKRNNSGQQRAPLDRE